MDKLNQIKGIVANRAISSEAALAEIERILDQPEPKLKVEGPFENDRNTRNAELFKDMIRQAYGAGDVIIAHHLTYVAHEMRDDGFSYEIVEEIPSADTLIFDHEAAQKIWGEDWSNVLTELALTPVPQRDERLAVLYYGRKVLK